MSHTYMDPFFSPQTKLNIQVISLASSPEIKFNLQHSQAYSYLRFVHTCIQWYWEINVLPISTFGITIWSFSHTWSFQPLWVRQAGYRDLPVGKLRLMIYYIVPFKWEMISRSGQTRSVSTTKIWINSVVRVQDIDEFPLHMYRQPAQWSMRIGSHEWCRYFSRKREREAKGC